MAEKTYSPDDDQWIDALVAKAEADAAAELKSGAATLKHQVRMVGVDELWILKAIELWDACDKHPLTGEMSPQAAGHMLGMLLQIQDPDTLRKLAVCSFGKVMNETRAVMAQLGRIACKRRGISFDVN